MMVPYRYIEILLCILHISRDGERELSSSRTYKGLLESFQDRVRILAGSLDEVWVLPSPPTVG